MDSKRGFRTDDAGWVVLDAPQIARAGLLMQKDKRGYALGQVDPKQRQLCILGVIT